MKWVSLVLVGTTICFGVVFWASDPNRARSSGQFGRGSGADGDSESSGPDSSTDKRGERNSRANGKKPLSSQPGSRSNRPRKRSVVPNAKALAAAGTWRKTVTEYARWKREGLFDSRDAPHLVKALRLAKNPVARQNLIFLTVRILPLKLARKELAPLAESGTPGDVEDVVCALAFAGDPAMGQWFSELAQRPSRANVVHLCDTLFEIELFETLANEDARDVLRSYRAYEILDRTNYFRLADQELNLSFPNRETPEGEQWRSLWKQWLARYPGHPGSDEVAIMLADHARWQRESRIAAYWYDRAATLPDQQRTSKALRRLVYMAERELKRSDLKKLLSVDVRNRDLLNYILVRRIAAEVNCEAALAAVDTFARHNPQSSISAAWRGRDASGSTEDPSFGRLGLMHDRIAASRTRTDRLFPPHESMPLSVVAMARQFAHWEQIVSLEKTAASAAKADRAAKLHSLAEFFLRSPDAFYPVYAHRTLHAGRMLNIQESRLPHRWGKWVPLTISAARAFELFRRIERAFPEYEHLDEAFGGQAAALASLLEIEALGSSTAGPSARDLRYALDACERCQKQFPESDAAQKTVQLALDCRARYPGLKVD